MKPIFLTVSQNRRTTDSQDKSSKVMLNLDLRELSMIYVISETQTL